MDKDEFVKQQAEAFLTYFNKEFLQAFDCWAQSKRFIVEDEEAIFHECLRIVKKENPSFQAMWHKRFTSHFGQKNGQIGHAE